MAKAILPHMYLCRKCGVSFPRTLDYFPPRKSTKDGMYCWCISCTKAYNKVNTEKNRKTDNRHIYHLIVDEKKQCSKCKEWKIASLDYFVPEKRSPSGLGARCRECNRTTQRDLYDSDRRKHYYAEHKERENELSRQYHSKHKIEINTRQTEYRKTDAFKQSKRKHRYKPQVYALDLLRSKVRFHAQHAKKLGLEGTITRHEWAFALDYFHGCCACCGRQFANLFDDHRVAMDHWIPISRNGDSTALNMLPLCHGKSGCNNKKYNKMPEQWLVEEFGKRKAKQILERINAYFGIVKNREADCNLQSVI